MNHFEKIAGMLETNGLDAVLLTCEANRFYASGFHSSGTDGVAIVTRNHTYYFTASRYTEAAARRVRDAESAAPPTRARACSGFRGFRTCRRR